MNTNDTVIIFLILMFFLIVSLGSLIYAVFRKKEDMKIKNALFVNGNATVKGSVTANGKIVDTSIQTVKGEIEIGNTDPTISIPLEFPPNKSTAVIKFTASKIAKDNSAIVVVADHGGVHKDILSFRNGVGTGTSLDVPILGSLVNKSDNYLSSSIKIYKGDEFYESYINIRSICEYDKKYILNAFTVFSGSKDAKAPINITFKN